MKVADRFDGLADIYDAQILNKVPQYDLLRQVLFDFVPFSVDAAGKVLDLGVGTGTTALEVLQKYPAAWLVGVDVSTKMLEHARLKLQPHESRTQLVQADFRSLPPLGKFDLVYSILAIHHLAAEDKQELFKKNRRQLADKRNLCAN
jgi:ubiquinone/menaquinone biosynthesis C-methylase UbiE